MEFVLVRLSSLLLVWTFPILTPRRGGGYLEISQLSEVLPTLFQFTNEGLRLLVHYPMCSNVAPLREPLAADIARERSFPGMPPLMGFSNVSCQQNIGKWLLTLQVS